MIQDKRKILLDSVRFDWKLIVENNYGDLKLFQIVDAYNLFLIMARDLGVSDAKDIIYEGMGLNEEAKQYKKQMKEALKWAKKNPETYERMKEEILARQNRA